ncbi:MAG: aerial mycelium formation protein [Actinomycetota bacterium]|nr:aerial mycelium formation protein [Actinomycetota bacterium]
MLKDDVARVLAPDDTSDLANLALDQLRARRAECTSVEAKVSYLRRLIHGANDIVGRELARRGEGAPPTDMSHLIDELPEALAANVNPGGHTRIVSNVLPPDVDEVTTELDALVDRRSLTALPDLSDDDLRQLADRLAEADRTLSRDRSALFQRIDSLAAELTRRYKAGEADVESVLP